MGCSTSAHDTEEQPVRVRHELKIVVVSPSTKHRQSVFSAFLDPSRTVLGGGSTGLDFGTTRFKILGRRFPVYVRG
jgi:hypothetical protein